MKAMRMNCYEAQAELPLFVGGDLESAVHERVAAHLESCISCRDALLAASESRDVLVAGLQQTADLHGAFVATSATPSVWPGLRDQLRSEGLIQTTAGDAVSTGTAIASGVGGSPAPMPRGRLLHWVSTSAAAAVLLLFGAAAGQFWNGSGSNPLPTGPIDQNQGHGASPVASIPADSSEVILPVSAGNSGSLVGLTPVKSSAPGLTRVECDEDSFIRDSLYFTGMEVQRSSPFPGSASGIRTVSLRGSTIPAPLPAPTASLDGIR